MKQQWNDLELAEYWRLSSNEWGFLPNRVNHNRLGVAILLKFFLMEGRFPASRKEVPSAAVDYMAAQLGVSPQRWFDYDFRGRSGERHRSRIRSLLGFRPATIEDTKRIHAWLLEECLPLDQKSEHLQAIILEWCRQQRLEPPTAERINRIIRAALRTHETEFCTAIAAQFSPTTCEAIDTLLHAPSSDNEASRERLGLDSGLFTELKKDPGRVVNATFAARRPEIWGEGTTACASDSKKFGAWDQNLMTEWHIRYGGRGVMIYWHVDKKAACIYSQLKRCSSSEVAAMIEGVLRHCTDMFVEKNYVDSHGQSEVAFAFCHLLGFDLLPRLKAIASQKLYRPSPGNPDTHYHLQPILTRPINWDLVRQQYDEMIKYAAALRVGTAEPEAILKRFTRANVQHPTYRALAELGKAVKTIFLCRYLHEEDLRREVHEGLNVVETWNSVNGFIFYGKGGEIATNRLEDQEIAVLSLHLLQACLVYINTLMFQQVLAEPPWLDKMTHDDFRALSPLIHAHVNPNGTIELDMTKRIPLDMDTAEY